MVFCAPTLQQVQGALKASDQGSLWAIDLETIGVDPSLPDSQIVGIGLANADTVIYLHWLTATDEVRQYVFNWLANVRLVAFNVLFDGAFLQAATGSWAQWEGCAYGLFRYLANEGFSDQSWGLEDAQQLVLGWPESNKVALREALDTHQLDKAEMWRLPPDILGPYCATDADAAWQLWEVLVESAAPFPYLMQFHKRQFMTEVKLLAEQQLRGMLVDREQLESHRADLDKRISQSLSAFLTFPEVAHHIAEYHGKVHEAWKASQPPQFNKNGEVAKRWEAWRDKEATFMAENQFNANSPVMLAWLFYERLYTIKRETPKKLNLDIGGKVYEVEKTSTGRRSVRKALLPLFGEPGLLLLRYNKLRKEAAYVDAARSLCANRETLHPAYNSCGTVTGRLAGGAEDEDS
jgi:DNA polymerase I-like protein with 3'-5' exonuclease and polymerase domains